MSSTELARPTPLEEYASVSESSLILKADTPIEAWEEIGQSLGRFGRSVNWLVGDWLVQGEQLFGERYAQGMEATGYRYQTLMNLASVASKIAPEHRRPDLSHAHHAEVAKFKTPAEQTHWLERAAADKLTVKELRNQIRAATGQPERPEADESACCFKAAEGVWRAVIDLIDSGTPLEGIRAIAQSNADELARR